MSESPIDTSEDEGAPNAYVQFSIDTQRGVHKQNAQSPECDEFAVPAKEATRRTRKGKRKTQKEGENSTVYKPLKPKYRPGGRPMPGEDGKFPNPLISSLKTTKVAEKDIFMEGMDFPRFHRKMRKRRNAELKMIPARGPQTK